MRRFTAVTAIVTVSFSVLACLASDIQAESTTIVRFAGSLTQEAADGDVSLREFEALLLKSTVTTFFSVLDDPRDGCRWPESFGQLKAPNGPSPHLLYSYDGSLYNIPLPQLSPTITDAAVGSTWSEGSWTFEIIGTTTQNGEAGFKVEARERRGRRQSLIVSENTGELIEAEQDVFMGQGQRFRMTVKRMSSKPLPDEITEQLGQLQSELLTLQASLNRRPDSQLAELSQRQVENAQSRITNLSQLAKDTPLQETVLRISRDLAQQQKRVAQAMNRREQLLQSDAPEFALNLIGNGTLKSEELNGKTVVLHFWKYSDKPLSEPYGQVGYLEFLYNKRKVNGVEVVGIAMNPSLLQAETNRSGQRSARKLAEFMNLTYPVGYDNCALLRELGDPREAGGELPLWVVVSPAGKIVHYHAGFYEVDRRQGLKDLDNVLIEQIKAANK